MEPIKVISVILFFVTISQNYHSVLANEKPSCHSPIYCYGQLLHVVQSAKIFKDSKTFVDMKLLFDEAVVLSNFNNLMASTNNNPNKAQIEEFVNTNFADGDELEPWTLKEFNENPSFLANVPNETLRTFAQNVVKIWPSLARIVKKDVLNNPTRYSLIPLPNGFIVPGGRFKEIYYWDTYWIINGLLISEMPNTVKGILNNFLHIVEKYGFMPNGARIYYLNRSHPPLLTLMVKKYCEYVYDEAWLERIIKILEKELTFFLQEKTVDIVIDGNKYTLAHYDSNSGSPRPESYSEDVETCEPLHNITRIKYCYNDLKSAAETGWDFSYRWVFDENGGNNANRTYIQTRRVVPVDLNTFLAMSFRDLASLYTRLGDSFKADYWNMKFIDWTTGIHRVLYNEEYGIWFDYDLKLHKQRTYFYPTNIAPLWAELFEPNYSVELGRNAYTYLINQKIVQYPGGIPTSLNKTGEQWDFPAAWAPLQTMVIQGLYRSNYQEAKTLAMSFAQKWIDSNLLGYQKTGKMFEKYDVEKPGDSGGGGEYEPQSGFGWTNGAALELIKEFFSTKS